ncbi:FMRFamide receptor-like [Tubulanus polymorphus]|uniref:FMRFamide receptor-like n=1 Tax=Tubulanus polymorphus TaxID=672921 RepID=UPI003DA50848
MANISGNQTTSSSVSYVETEIADSLLIYGSAIIIILGTIGNILAIIVFSARPVSSKPTSILMRLLAIFDTLVLYTGLLRYWILATWKYDIRSYSLTTCLVHTYLLYVFVTISVWILVTVTIHRLIVVVVPLKAKTMLTMKSLFITMLALLIFSLTLNLHMLWTVEWHDRRCMPQKSFWWDHVWPKIDLCINALIPFVVLMLCNAVIIWKVHESAKKVTKSSSGVTTKSRLNSMTAMLISVNFVFLICNLPLTVYNLDIFKPNTDHQNAIDWLIWAILNLLMYTNNAANFYIYSISGPRFRGELISLFTCREDSKSTNPSLTDMSTKRNSSNKQHHQSNMNLVDNNYGSIKSGSVEGVDNSGICDTYM